MNSKARTTIKHNSLTMEQLLKAICFVIKSNVDHITSETNARNHHITHGQLYELKLFVKSI